MKKHLGALASVWTLVLSSLWAGGPLFVDSEGTPFRWGGDPPVVRIYPDAGGLGAMSAEAALSALLYSADQWSTVPSASIRLENAGFVQSVVGPEGPGDYSVETILDFVGINNGGISPIVFDNEDADDNGNGDIFDLLGLSSGVLGISFPEFADGTRITEGVTIFNGSAVDPADPEGTEFRGIFTHELGHLLGLAHSVVNGQALFFGGSDAETPDGQPMIVGPEDLETMYPYSDPTPGGTGAEEATLHRDDIAILSTLYPSVDVPLASFGSIRGQLLEAGILPRMGGQIIARNQAGNPLQDAVSAISGDYAQFAGSGPGSYLINGLTPGGRYSLEVRDTVAGGFSTPVFASPDGYFYSEVGLLPGPEEYFSGPIEDSKSPPDNPEAAPYLIDQTSGSVLADIFLNDFPRPINDNCSNAPQILSSALPYYDKRKTRGATVESLEPRAACGSWPEDRSVWYLFRNDTGQVEDFLFSTEGTDYSTIIQAYLGSCQLMSPVTGACSNGLEMSGSNRLRLRAHPNVLYRIQVADSWYEPTGGDLRLRVERIASSGPSNDSCLTSVPVTDLDLPFSDEADTSLATIESLEPTVTCAYGGSDPLDSSVWYRFTNTSAGPVPLVVSTSETDYDTAIQVYAGDCLHTQPTACDDDSGEPFWFNSELTTVVGVGQSILVKVAAYGAGGNLILRMDRADPPPSNDDRQDAVGVRRRDLPFVDLIDTSQASNERREPRTQCGSSSVPEQSASVWYAVTNDLVVPMNLVLSTEGSGYDTVIQAYSAPEGQADPTPLSCDDDSGTGLLSRLPLRAEPGHSYLIKVSGWGSDGGGDLLFSVDVEGGGLTSGDLILTALPPETIVTARSEMTYTFDLRNLVETPISNVRLNLHPAPDLELVSVESPRGSCESDGDLNCFLGTMAAGEDLLLTLTASPRQSGTTSLTALLSWDDAQADETSRSASLVSDVAPYLVFPFSMRSEPPSGSLPASADIGTDFIGSAVVNPANRPGGLVLEGLDAQGTCLFLSDPPADLDPLGQKAFTSGDLGPGAGGSESLIARGTETPLEGFFMSGDARLTRLDGIGGPIVESKTLYFQIARETATESTTLFLFNPTVLPAEPVEIVLFDGQGVQAARRSLALPPRGTLRNSVRNLFEIGGSFEGGYVRVEAPVPLRGFEFHGSGTYLEALPARPAEFVWSLWSPHFFLDRQGGRTDIRLLSADAGIVDVQVEAFDDGGSQLGTASLELLPGRLVVADVGQLLGLSPPAEAPLSGYLRLTLEPRGFIGVFAPAVRVLGSTSFTAQAGRARSTLTLVPTSSKNLRFLHVAQSAELSLFTGLALQNPSTYGAVTVDLKAVDSAGVVTATKTVKLEAGERLLGLLSDDPFFGPGFEQVGGHLEVSASSGLIAFALFGDFNSQYLSAIEGQPVSP